MMWNLKKKLEIWFLQKDIMNVCQKYIQLVMNEGTSEMAKPISKTIWGRGVYVAYQERNP